MKRVVFMTVFLALFVVSSLAIARGGKEEKEAPSEEEAMPVATGPIELDFTPLNRLIPSGKYKPIAPPDEMNLGLFEVWDLQLPRPANQLGFLTDVNINVADIKDFHKETPMMEALQHGSVDSAGTAVLVTVPLFKTLDKIIWGPPHDSWWGNAVMARPGKYKTFEEFMAELGDEEEATFRTCKQLEGQVLNTMLGAGHENFIQAVLERGGLTMDDVIINDLPHMEGAAAFIRGEGDFFLGDLPGRYRVAEEGAIPIIGGSLFGQEAWCFVGYLFNKDWLDNNEETALRFISQMYRVADVLSGPDKEEALEIMRVAVNDMSGASFTMEQAHIVNSQISPWQTFEEAKETYFNPDHKFNWNDRVQYLIDWYTEQGKIEEGDVSVEAHSRAEELFNKLWNYKQQSERDMIAVAEAYNADSVKDKEKVRSLMDQAKWNWDIRNYLDASTLAADARSLAGI